MLKHFVLSKSACTAVFDHDDYTTGVTAPISRGKTDRDLWPELAGRLQIKMKGHTIRSLAQELGVPVYG
jgi:hypothetical protein